MEAMKLVGNHHCGPYVTIFTAVNKYEQAASWCTRWLLVMAFSYKACKSHRTYPVTRITQPLRDAIFITCAEVVKITLA